ncbi:hypothetical protein EP7_002418 [Isosphaeraceae bacterium EP7]
MGPIEVSQKRIDANRRNAMRSTGPKTVEGKEKSRRNSLIHGLSGAGVVVPQDQAQAVRERAEQWNSSLRPMNAFEIGLVETIAVESLRIERCRLEERLARDARARRATNCWADERKAEIARVARTLPRRPEEIAARLSITAPGCDWMIDRWRALGHALDKSGAWTDEQEALALDLLGVEGTLRDLHTPLDAPEGMTPLDHRQELVDDQLERLLGRKESSLDDLEEDGREAAIMGLTTGDDRTLVLLRRYETASFRRMKWALDLMQRGRSRPADPARSSRWDHDGPASYGPASPATEEQIRHCENARRSRLSYADMMPPEFAERPQPVGAERTHPGPAAQPVHGHFAKLLMGAMPAEVTFATPEAAIPPLGASPAPRRDAHSRRARSRRHAAHAQLIAC